MLCVRVYFECNCVYINCLGFYVISDGWQRNKVFEKVKLLLKELRKFIDVEYDYVIYSKNLI